MKKQDLIVKSKLDSDKQKKMYDLIGSSKPENAGFDWFKQT